MYKIGISEKHVFEWLMAPCVVHPTRDICTPRSDSAWKWMRLFPSASLAFTWACCTASCNTIESHIDTTQYNILCVQNSDLRPLPYVTTTAHNNCMSSLKKRCKCIACIYVDMYTVFKAHSVYAGLSCVIMSLALMIAIAREDSWKGEIYWLYIADIGLSRHYLMRALYN